MRDHLVVQNRHGPGVKVKYFKYLFKESRVRRVRKSSQMSEEKKMADQDRMVEALQLARWHECGSEAHSCHPRLNVIDLPPSSCVFPSVDYSNCTLCVLCVM